ncbi:MAG: fasciclin domain-containing protein [Parachlamydiaceae bacterium]
MKKFLLGLAVTAFSVMGLNAGSYGNEKNVVQIAQANADFSTLVQAVVAADLANTLQGQGPFTVFAPTNQAFANLPAGTVQELLKPENKAKLQAILTYHVVPGKVLSSDLKSGKVKTVNGKEIDVVVENGQVKINNAKVIKADIQGTNGVVHVIDAVLLP